MEIVLYSVTKWLSIFYLSTVTTRRFNGYDSMIEWQIRRFNGKFNCYDSTVQRQV